jgi:uncharacterized membrane protein YfcA
MIWLEYAMTGLFAGFLAGYLGIGGGLVLVPVLSWLFSHDPATADMAVQMAVATSLATMLFTSMSSILSHHKRGAIMWELVKQMIPGLLAGAFLGSFVADRIGNTALGYVFGIFALLVGVQMLLGRKPQGDKSLPGAVSMATTGLGIGTISSLLGIGGGSLTVPWLLWHGKRAQNAIATAAACGYPIAVAGTLGFMLMGGAQTSTPTLGYVHLPALAGVALFSVFGAPLGVAAVHRSSPMLAKRLFAVFLLVVAVKMLLR